MAIIEKKIWPEFFEKILTGKKQFELRVADFKIAEGDTLLLKEWDPKIKKYTGRKIKKKASYVLKFDLDKFEQKELVEKYGLYVIQLE